MNMLREGTPAMEAYVKIKTAICQQKLKPGVVLTESYLCGALDMGRSPIRAALQQLSQDGFVDMPPNRSARVAQFSHNQIRQLYSLRGMLLSYALELTIDTYGEKDLEAPEELLRQQEQAFKNYEFEQYLSAVREFFAFMIQKAGNPYLDEIAEGVLSKINVFLCLYDNFYCVEKLKSLPLFRKILESIRQKKLKAVMNAHKELNNRVLDAYDYMILSNTQ